MTTTISYVLPTRDRPGDLARTLAALGAMGRHDAEVIVVDNASVTRPHIAARLTSGVPVCMIRREQNDGAAGRNAGAKVAAGEWIVMLDDDSHPTCDADTLLGLLDRQPANVGAVMADIRLPRQGTREAGGLPEVFTGCGVAIRREIFLGLGGYDPTFGYYVEEYDLAARMLLDGLRVVFEPAFRVDHHKASAGRDMDLILHRLVRNNAWVMQRYAPEAGRRAELRHLRARYRGIARKEGASAGFARGIEELRRTIAHQPRRPMPPGLFARFTGLAAARRALEIALADRRNHTASIVAAGKYENVVRQALHELGIRVVDHHGADLTVIGTMSPGPMLDAASADREQVQTGQLVVPWRAAAHALLGGRVQDRAGTRAASPG